MYASRTGTRRNLTALRANGFRLLVSATGCWRPEGFCYALDSGAWTYHQAGQPFDFGRYFDLIRELGPGADWAVLPDVVGDPVETRRLAEEWAPIVSRVCPVLMAIQDGAMESDFEGLPIDGLFLGGSTEYKVGNAVRWGTYARARRLYYHVGRVNTAKRISLCQYAGADSADGTSATRFAVNARRLGNAIRQGSLFGNGSGEEGRGE
jgi:hypothetical protein